MSLSQRYNLDNLDEVFDQIGQLGAYQITLFVLVGLTAFIPSITSYEFIFTGAIPDFRYTIAFISVIFSIGSL